MLRGKNTFVSKRAEGAKGISLMENAPVLVVLNVKGTEKVLSLRNVSK